MRSGRRIAFDVGKARIGVALSDFHAILASPIEHIVRTSELQSAIDIALSLVESNSCIEAYVGLPVNLKNIATESTQDAIDFASALASRTSIEVRMIDERFTTATASASLRMAGHSARQQKSLIDSAAAAVILEQALSHEKAKSTTPGISIEEAQDAL